jgi:Cd2+/Zn2+-exporting ATPase
MVMALYAIAELIEARSVDRARNAIKGLLDLTPDTAEVRQPDGTWQPGRRGSVALDAVVRPVKPGARIPLDGTVTSGASAVNQAPVTGESMPVDKGVGDTLVFAGTINDTGTLEVRVTAGPATPRWPASSTPSSRRREAVRPRSSLSTSLPRSTRPVVFALAVAVAVLAPWLMDVSWTQALYKALVMLVIACPCALVSPRPVTVVSGLAAAARRGILDQGRRLSGRRLQTQGHCARQDWHHHGRQAQTGGDRGAASPIPESQVLRWAGDLAGHSDHPVSRAIARELDQGNGQLAGLTALPGRGIVQAGTEGQTLILGNHRLIEERGLCSPEIEARLAVHEAQGRTVTMLATDAQVLAIFAVADTIKESSRQALAELHALGVVSVMLTGDNTATAQTIARQAGIDDARATCCPRQAVGHRRPAEALWPHRDDRGRHQRCPALARADIGIAMGAAGTDTAMEAADVVIMNDDLRRIPEVIRLSRRTRAVLWQNIVLALGIKAVFLVLAVSGSATMWMAVFADMGASLLVVFNGLRMLRTSGMERVQ